MRNRKQNGRPWMPVRAYHLILTCYGFWLPNDPRGSGSFEVWSDALKPFGPATGIDSERSVAHKSHDRTLRRQAKLALDRPPVRLTGIQALHIAHAFAHWFDQKGVMCFACAVMPDHAHVVIDRPGVMTIEATAKSLKAVATRRLCENGLHPHQDCYDRGERVPKMWARGERHPFLFDDAQVRSRIRYVNDNPTNAGLKPQRWSFVRSFRGLDAVE